MERSLEDTVVLVTGASSGIGRAAVRSLVGGGALVTATGRRTERLKGLQEELGSERVHFVAADVRSAEENRRVVDECLERWGRLDSVVINAGVGLYGGILDRSDDDLAGMIETNLNSTVWLIRSTVPHLLERGGDIVVVASVAGLSGGPDEAVYAATKFGQVGLAAAVDRELRQKNIRVTTICPAAVATEFAVGTGREADMAEMQDWLKPEDIAAAIEFSLRQPRRLRTTQWAIWSAAQAS